jgi:hypothetical protein
VLHQVRPDEARRDSKGRVLKYETPRDAGVKLDVHPSMRAALGAPDVPLLVTEGVKKVDAAATAGLCCVGLLGVDSWRGRNSQGGLTALIEWNDVHLRGRSVLLCFDSDVMVKAAGRDSSRGPCGHFARPHWPAVHPQTAQRPDDPRPALLPDPLLRRGPGVGHEPIYHREDGSERIEGPKRLPFGGFFQETSGGWDEGTPPPRATVGEPPGPAGFQAAAVLRSRVLCVFDRSAPRSLRRRLIYPLEQGTDRRQLRAERR